MIRTVVLTAALTAGFAGVALGQDSVATEPNVTEDEPGTFEIQEVIVTATKRRKSARDIPLSIDAFSGDELNKKGAQSAQDALADSPGVSVNSYFSPNLATVQVRGTTVDTVTTTNGSPSGSFLDDIPLNSPTLIGGNPNIDVFDLATVEVLKGPQGTLFGGSALAGALRSTPNLPELQSFSGEIFYSPISVSQSARIGQDYGAVLNIPVGETFAARLMGVRRGYPGAIDNLRDGIQDADRNGVDTWRGLLRWEPLEALSVQALYHDTQGFVEDATATDNPDRLERSDESGRSPIDFRYSIGQLKAEYSFELFSVAGAASRVRKTDHLTLQLDGLLGSQTPVTDLQTGPQTYTADIRTYELRAVSNERSQSGWLLLRDWDWLIGLFDYRADQTGFSPITALIRPPLPVPPVPVQAESVDIVSKAKERALYFDLTRYLGDKFEINLGGRLFQQRLFGSSVTSLGPVAGISAPADSGNQNADGFNPKLALTWHVMKQVSLRAAAIKGFRFGGVNIIVDQDPRAPKFYTTDELWNYEVGLRSDWLDRRLRFDVTGFYIDWSRTQVSQRTATGLSTFVDNVGSAVSQGVELQTRALLPFGFSFNAGGAYVDARTAADFQGINGPVPKGSRLPGTPYLTGAASVGYGRALGKVVLDGGVNWNYQGEAFNDLAHANVIPEYYFFGAHLGLALPNLPGAPTLAVNATNLLDRRAYSALQPPVTPAEQGNLFFPTRPRTISLRVSASF